MDLSEKSLAKVANERAPDVAVSPWTGLRILGVDSKESKVLVEQLHRQTGEMQVVYRPWREVPVAYGGKKAFKWLLDHAMELDRRAREDRLHARRTVWANSDLTIRNVRLEQDNES